MKKADNLMKKLTISHQVRALKHLCALSILCFVCASTCKAQTLKETVGRHFLIGVAMNQWQVDGQRPQAADVVRNHFNAIVAENCMKPESLEPREGVFTWDSADRFVSFGEDNNLTVIGHTLLWHAQTGAWMFAIPDSIKDNRDAVRRLMTGRMRNYIHAVVGHFKGRVHGWDVINEAFLDNGEVRPSPWFKALGYDYFELAFRFAHEADPEAELYYNDYSMSLPAKRDAVCRLVRHLKSKGCRIDAVGMQSHLGLSYPKLSDYEATIDSLAACGVKIGITELDVSVLPNPWDFSGAEISQSFDYEERMNPYREGLPREVEKQLEERYLALFSLYKKHKKDICRVNFWGVCDGESWLNGFPIKGRTNYPLLFDRQYKARKAVKKIAKMYRK